MYKLPDTLSKDIEKFGALAAGYQKNTVSGVEFKAFRVPMGVYEQRKNEVYMARIRATGGVITPEQLIKVIDIAKANGSDLLHITTRAEIQILNLELDKVQNVLEQLKGAELATKGGGGNTVRNILVSEFSGISDNEVFDTTPYAMALTDAVVPEADSYLMPRKMKIAFSSDENYEDYANINDVGLVAKIKDGKRGFKVYIGGGAGAKPTIGWLYKEFIPVEDLYALVKGLKDFFNAHGNRKDKYKARIRFIFYKLGQEETFKLIDQYFEKAKAEGKTLDVHTEDYPHSKASDKTVVLPFIWGNIWINDDEKVKALKDVLNYVAKFGKHTVRFTPRQNIRLRNIPESALPELEKLLAAYTPEYGKPAVLNNVVSCTGADTCRLGICLSKGLAEAIRKRLEDSDIDLKYLDDARINISGCPNLCGQPLWTDLGFVGKVLHSDHAYPAYQIYVGASYEKNPSLAQSVGTVAAYKIPELVERLVRRYVETTQLADLLFGGEGEQSLSFGKWLRSPLGQNEASKLVAEYANVPLFSEDKNYYFDWGSNDVFNVTKRGKPECSAGLFDMITVDQESIKEALGKNNYNVIFHASRMLLVTRGLDPQQPADVFDAFIEHFINAGYVDDSFKSLVLQAKQDGENGNYDGEKAKALADAVNGLYANMDDALQFKKPADTAVETHGRASQEGASQESTKDSQSNVSSPAVTRSKDLRGVLCPMNFVRTKLELATLQSGDVLEILLDDGKPIENVPGSVRLEGHTVISEKQQPEGHWQVLIKKK
ncbi:MAG: sulfurtransferase TusA family protein [Bacteroidales bacterium]|nr:sulfurtransferase TusA family protein [Candidatus Scybalocola fimicaballi]